MQNLPFGEVLLGSELKSSFPYWIKYTILIQIQSQCYTQPILSLYFTLNLNYPCLNNKAKFAKIISINQLVFIYLECYEIKS